MKKEPEFCPECGCALLERKPAKARSYPQLQRIHALCRAAYFHWPVDNEFQPKNADHMRYFLECEAGYFTAVRTIRITGDTDPNKLAAVLTAVLRASDDDKMFVDVDGLLVTVKKVGSIAYDKLGHYEACDLFTKMEDVLYRYDVDAEKLLHEARSA